MTIPDWKKLEHLAAEIQSELSPRSKVTHNVKVPGKKSGTNRQIDVLIEDYVGQFPIRIAIDCKDYSGPADVTDIGSFHSLLDDTGISKSVLVCPSGFSATALRQAASLGIETYRPVHTDHHKWRCQVSLPTLCDFRSASIGLSLSFSQPLPLTLPYRFEMLTLFDEYDQPTVSIAETAARAWEEGRLPIEPGTHRVPLCGQTQARIDNGHGRIVAVELTALMEVRSRKFFGQTPISKVKGFQDVQTGALITNAFELGALDPDEVERSWVQLDEDGTPQPASLIVRGLYCIGVHPA